jgi:hypothetical protein
LLNNFSFKKKICDPCLFWGTYYDALDGYEINGQKQDIPVQISK